MASPPQQSAAVDRWMQANPWHPRIAPFLAYIAMLPVVDLVGGWSLLSYPLLYAIQCLIVAGLLWRYRSLLPELNIRFHWLAVPSGIGLCAAWILLGNGMIQLSPGWFAPSDEEHMFVQMQKHSAALYYTSLSFRLLGMSLLVPLFEELFVRSACLRGLHSAHKTKVAVWQMLEDMPLVGDWLIHLPISRRVTHHPPMMTQQLNEWPVGRLTLFGVIASTFVFMIHHIPRDWPGTIACGICWCVLLWWTNRGPRRLGLGPIVWSHGITNACLWLWCLKTGQWYFL